MRAACLGALLPLAACSVAPPYQRPDIAAMPAAFKEAGALWQPAQPADAIDRGEWWTLFQDEDLNRLAAQVQLSNQNIAAAVAAYAQAQALVREQGAALLPSVNLSGSETRAGGEGSARRGTTAQAALGASWAPDLWGRLGSTVSGAQASAQASQADLASARLSAVGSLVAAYFQLREADAEIALLQEIDQAYQRSLQITRNRYEAGVAPASDVQQARTQLANAQADLATVRQNRARYEHAIAVLTGVAPGSFSLPPAAWVMRVPQVPAALPSELLQRRPDIASAERAVAAANAQIGVQRAAYFPSLSLSASLGRTGSSVGDLFNAPGTLWSLGLSVAQTVFDGGAIAARVDEARAARDARAASYPDGADRLPGRGRPAHHHPHPADPGAAAPGSRERRAPDRNPAAEPLPCRPGQLYRRGHRADRRAQRPAHAAAAAGQPPAGRSVAGAGAGRRLAGAVEHRQRTGCALIDPSLQGAGILAHPGCFGYPPRRAGAIP